MLLLILPLILPFVNGKKHAFSRILCGKLTSFLLRKKITAHLDGYYRVKFSFFCQTNERLYVGQDSKNSQNRAKTGVVVP